MTEQLWFLLWMHPGVEASMEMSDESVCKGLAALGMNAVRGGPSPDARGSLEHMEAAKLTEMLL